ncbi:hypothetical protein TVAG_367820 [Trichomonas vaginalis G3]|uniref:Uncharacterized protein n=1 Tax=Trichomonas vaginalis (strain ATCC PRA-98 / G3) TaxID=412133 RepID=A2G3S3_TRIV3|nr:hypothetical protein TVAGG3_0117600 [Trichomonas vaginalis G3]EAX88184.1 hypothetical protein TVAG_367820 [Trichomonas vaginalis G3]KAI5545267.1 hypothetical protein TVAGG3_0117600 [Trichomonas vaginalis G3]|eukprot:XP_001301114.1 hypothetical protein [Trichomonas vaginalis G3]
MSNRQSPLSPSRTRSTIVQPTFADGPAAFLQQLATKVQSTSSMGSGNGAEIQRVRSQLTTEVQNSHSKQEMKMRQLDSQLTLLQQKIRPQLQNIERQQGFTQNQLDQLRNRVQNLISDDISPLQQKYDQLGLTFDRFLRVELESKLRPMQDDLRISRTKLDELLSNVTNGFQRINDSVEELTSNIDQTSNALALQKSKFDKRIGEISPKVDNIEAQIKELQNILDGAEGFGSSFTTLDKTIKSALDNVQYLQNEYIPQKINESSATFIEKMGTLSTRTDSDLSNIQSELDAILAQNQQAEVERKDAEHNLESLITSSFEVENALTTLETETKTKIDTISHDMDSSISQIHSRLSELKASGDDEDRLQTKLDDSVEDLKRTMEQSLRDLREKIRVTSSKNLKAQQSTYSLLTNVRNTLEGDENILGYLSAVEAQINWCVRAIQAIDADRIKAQEIGADPTNIAGRAKNIDERVSNALLRVTRLEEARKRGAAAQPEEDQQQQPQEEEKPKKKPQKKQQQNDEEEEKQEEEKPKKKSQKKGEEDDEELPASNEEKPKKKAAQKKEQNEDDEEPPADEKPKKKKQQNVVEEEDE